MTATIFTTTTCAYCKMVKQYLSKKGVQYTEVNLDDNPDQRQSLYELTGAMTVPITQIGAGYIIGWKPAELALATA